MITVIVPIHQITPNRDLKRLYYQLLSLENQSYQDFNVVVSSDSTGKERFEIIQICLKWEKMVDFIFHKPQPGGFFNFPYLINRGIETTDSEWILVTGVDLIYHPDYLKTLLEMSTPNTFTMSYGRMIQMPDYVKMKDHWITEWKWPREYQRNAGAEAACGVSFSHRSWFNKSQGMCEKFVGYSGQDEEWRNRARNAGLKLQWLDRNVLHLAHVSGKDPKKPSRDQRRNWKLVKMMDEAKVINWRKYRKYLPL